MSAIKEHMIANRGSLVSDLLLVHVRVEIEGVGAERPRSIGKTRGPNLERAPVVTRVCGQSHIGEAVLVQNGRIRPVGYCRIGAGMGRTLHLPTAKSLRQ